MQDAGVAAAGDAVLKPGAVRTSSLHHFITDVQEKHMIRALLQAVALGAAGIIAGAGAQAASPQPVYPTKPIRIVVPFTAGSATDIMARLIGPKMVDRWGKQVVTDNRP